VSGEFDAYCEQAMAVNTSSRMPQWVLPASAAVAATAFLALVVLWPRAASERHAIAVPPAVVASVVGGDTRTVVAPTAAPVREIHRRHFAAAAPKKNPITARIARPVHDQVSDAVEEEPVIRIAIPADEMFPPGAVPEGIRFAADLTIAADGSAERLRLRPRLVGFERSTTQP
jgi:hypothetical protein